MHTGEDLTARLNGLYETVYEIEEAIEDALLRKKAFEEEKMTLGKIREILVTFDEVYDIMDESEQKAVVAALVKEVHINANDSDKRTLLRKVIFNFPVYYNEDNDAHQVIWEGEGGVETLFLFRMTDCYTTPISDYEDHFGLFYAPGDPVNKGKPKPYTETIYKWFYGENADTSGLYWYLASQESA